MIKPFPVVTLENPTPSERFAQWVRHFGVFRLGRSLDMDFRSVRFWLAGKNLPSVKVARLIIALSGVEPLNGQPLTFEDIYGCARAEKVEVRQVQRVQAWE